MMTRFTLRLPETLHQELESRASLEGVSLNQYIVYALTRQVASAYTIQVLPDKTVTEQRAQYEKLLDSLGQPSLSATQNFLAGREQMEPESGLTESLRAQIQHKLAANKAE
jgi:uncharacterized protein (DUF1778 family)